MRRSAGFSLIEVAISLVVFALLVLSAVPSVGRWVANARVRSAAEVLQNSLRLAQAEALKRNRQTVFALTNDVPGMAARPVGNGTRWYVRALPLSAVDPVLPSDYVEGSSAGAAGVQVAGPALICFNALGRQTVNLATGLSADCDAADDVTYAVTGTGQANRRLNVKVSFAGRVRMCDPDRHLDEGEADGC